MLAFEISQQRCIQYVADDKIVLDESLVDCHVRWWKHPCIMDYLLISQDTVDGRNIMPRNFSGGKTPVAS